MANLAAKNLKLIRARLFLTQEAFGRYFNLTRHMVNSYEMGRAKVPASLINQICRTFNLSAQAFTEKEWTAEEPQLSGVTLQALETNNDTATSTSQVNEWREKYYIVLEKYNDALEELRRFRKQEE